MVVFTLVRTPFDDKHNNNNNKKKKRKRIDFNPLFHGCLYRGDVITRTHTKHFEKNENVKRKKRFNLESIPKFEWEAYRRSAFAAVSSLLAPPQPQFHSPSFKKRTSRILLFVALSLLVIHSTSSYIQPSHWVRERKWHDRTLEQAWQPHRGRLSAARETPWRGPWIVK